MLSIIINVMKQRIAVRIILKQENRTLLLKRSNGRESIVDKYELPGGRLAFLEQPEDAVYRYIKVDVGLKIKTAKLIDAISYIDKDYEDIQYILLLYRVEVELDANKKIKLSENYSDYLWINETESVDSNMMTDSTYLILNIYNQVKDKINFADSSVGPDETDVKDDTYAIIYSDGGSRGNPGPSAIGYVIMNQYKEIIKTGGEYIGITNNNVAEYKGAALALKEALKMGIKKIDFKMDSSLVVNQLNGVYKVKNRELWQIHDEVTALMKRFEKINFTHIKREHNQLADAEVNHQLDCHERQNCM